MTETTCINNYVIITIPQIGEIKIKSATEYGKVNYFLGYIEACREHGEWFSSRCDLETIIINKARDMGILEE